jgi:hypothetical protein
VELIIPVRYSHCRLLATLNVIVNNSAHFAEANGNSLRAGPLGR